MRRALLVVAGSFLLGATACGDLRAAGPDAPRPDAPPAPTAPPQVGLSPPSSSAARTWDAAVQELARTRGVGPTVPPTASMSCSATRVFWQDEGGRVASWSTTTRTTLRYAPTTSSDVRARPSDAFVPLRPPVGMTTRSAYAYRADVEDERVGEIPFGDEVVATDDAIVAVSQKRGSWVNKPTATEVVVWRPGRSSVSIVDDLPVESGRYLGFGAGKLVIASPSTTYVLGIDGTRGASLPIEAGSKPMHAAPTAEGVFVTSVRRDAAPALRFYAGADATRIVDIGEVVRSIPPLVDDAPLGAHEPGDGPIAAYASHVLFASSFGIFAYAEVTGALKALVLHPRADAGPTELCVMPGAATLAYRRTSDPAGQVWTLPLDTLSP